MNFFWPDVDDKKNAHNACVSAGGMAFFIAIVTGVIAWLQATGKINILPGIEKTAFIDVALFIVIGIGLLFHSRVAAVAGLLLYSVERVLMIKMSGFHAGQVTGMILFGLAFINGVRGTFAWHEQKKTEKGETGLEGKEETGDKPKKSFPVKTLFLLVVLIAVAGAAYFFLIKKGTLPSMEALTQKTKTLTKSIAPKKAAETLVAPQGPTIKLKLKSGRSFDGILVKKNSEGYWIFITGMGEVYFSVSEVAEAS